MNWVVRFCRHAVKAGCGNFSASLSEKKKSPRVPVSGVGPGPRGYFGSLSGRRQSDRAEKPQRPPLGLLFSFPCRGQRGLCFHTVVLFCLFVRRHTPRLADLNCLHQCQTENSISFCFREEMVDFVYFPPPAATLSVCVGRRLNGQKYK